MTRDFDPPVPESASDSRPPIHRPPLASFPVVPLSYSALAQYRDCPARFFATRVLRLSQPEPPATPDELEEYGDPELNPELVKQSVDSTAFGVAVHEILELLPERLWQVPSEQTVRDVLATHGIRTDPEVGTASRMVEGFLDSELGRLVKEHRVDVESSLLIEIDGVMVRGFADLLVRSSSPPLILDYKSNQLESTSTEELMTKYDLQRDLYALAVAQFLEAEEVETAFVFLRDPGNPVRDRFDVQRLARARDSVSRLIGDISAGRYLGGSQAAHQPCGECWACEVLAGQIAAADRVLSS